MRASTLVQQLAGLDFGPVLSVAFRGFGSESGRECHRPDLPWQTWNEPLSRYDVTVTVGCDGGYLPDPAAFTAAAGQAAWGRSASIISAHLANKIISVVTVTAPPTGTPPRPSPGPWYPARSSARSCHPARQQTSMPVTVRRFAARRAREPPPPWQALHDTRPRFVTAHIVPA